MNLRISMVLVAALAFTACSKDKDDDKKPQAAPAPLTLTAPKTSIKQTEPITLKAEGGVPPYKFKLDYMYASANPTPSDTQLSEDGVLRVSHTYTTGDIEVSVTDSAYSSKKIKIMVAPLASGEKNQWFADGGLLKWEASLAFTSPKLIAWGDNEILIVQTEKSDDGVKLLSMGRFDRFGRQKGEWSKHSFELPGLRKRGILEKNPFHVVTDVDKKAIFIGTEEAVGKFGADGKPDPAFQVFRLPKLDPKMTKAAISGIFPDPQGRVWVVGAMTVDTKEFHNTRIFALRILANGLQDPFFGPNGVVIVAEDAFVSPEYPHFTAGLVAKEIGREQPSLVVAYSGVGRTSLIVRKLDAGGGPAAYFGKNGISEIVTPGITFQPQAMWVSDFNMVIGGSTRVHDNEMNYLMELDGQGKTREYSYRPITLFGRDKSWEKMTAISRDFSVLDGDGVKIVHWNTLRDGITETVVTLEEKCKGDVLDVLQINGLMYVATKATYSFDSDADMCLIAVKR